MEVSASANLSSLNAYNPVATNTAKQTGSLSSSQAQTQTKTGIQNQTENRPSGLGIGGPPPEQRNPNPAVAANATVQEAEKAAQKKLIENAENISKAAKKVVFEYDKRTGDSVVKYMDAKGNVVTQVPPEQYLKLKELLGDSNSLDIQEISADAKEMKETGVIVSKKV
ncbi:MAG: hypothetical protein EPN22_03830 [Nitrospirae bacterium]|nr:MAG: hypothetical protein EPN22_03830 [Nitrospirota bacterium]